MTWRDTPRDAAEAYRRGAARAARMRPGDAPTTYTAPDPGPRRVVDTSEVGRLVDEALDRSMNRLRDGLTR
jgi:hypothetical protein